MLTYYMSKYLLKAVGGQNATTIVVEGVEEEHIKEAAEATEGFSGDFFFFLCQNRLKISLPVVYGVTRVFFCVSYIYIQRF